MRDNKRNNDNNKDDVLSKTLLFTVFLPVSLFVQEAVRHQHNTPNTNLRPSIPTFSIPPSFVRRYLPPAEDFIKALTARREGSAFLYVANFRFSQFRMLSDVLNRVMCCPISLVGSQPT